MQYPKIKIWITAGINFCDLIISPANTLNYPKIFSVKNNLTQSAVNFNLTILARKN